MNKHTIHGKTTELKGKVQNAWGKATGDKMEQAKGAINQVKGKVETKLNTKQEPDGRPDELEADVSKNIAREGNKGSHKGPIINR